MRIFQINSDDINELDRLPLKEFLSLMVELESLRQLVDEKMMLDDD